MWALLGVALAGGCGEGGVRVVGSGDHGRLVLVRTEGCRDPGIESPDPPHLLLDLALWDLAANEVTRSWTILGPADAGDAKVRATRWAAAEADLRTLGVAVTPNLVPEDVAEWPHEFGGALYFTGQEVVGDRAWAWVRHGETGAPRLLQSDPVRVVGGGPAKQLLAWSVGDAWEVLTWGPRVIGVAAADLPLIPADPALLPSTAPTCAAGTPSAVVGSAHGGRYALVEAGGVLRLVDLAANSAVRAWRGTVDQHRDELAKLGVTLGPYPGGAWSVAVGTDPCAFEGVRGRRVR